MFSRFSFLVVWLLVVPQFVFGGHGRPPSKTEGGQSSLPSTIKQLRVCSDPNNLPFSNDKLQGFENRIAEVIAKDLNARLEYTWWAQRRGFIRNTLKAGKCDLIIGIPSSMEMALTTKPYYRSSYVFVYKKNAAFSLQSFDDPILHKLKIGVQVIGDDFANTPPVHALNRRNIVNNLVGYSILGDYSRPAPQSEIIKAVATGKVDAAVAWGPTAAYFAAQQKTPLEVTPVSPQIDLPFLPFVFDISAGVRRGEDQFLQTINRVLDKRKAEIDEILEGYHVPRIDLHGNRIAKSS